MNLEDHLGDIIRKGRAMSNVSAAAAARAAGLSEGELTALESSGLLGKRPSFPALGALTGLDGAKLEGIANGWLPAEADLSGWRELRLFTTNDGGMAVNCFLIWDEVTREAAVFDTGWEAKPVLKTIEEYQLLLRHLFITHTHEDHVAALGQFRQAFPKVRLHSG